MNISIRTLFLTMTLIFATSSFAGLFGEKNVKWSQIPIKVQNTITEHLQGGEIKELKKEKKKKTITVYEAKIKRPDGKKIEIKVEEDGTLLELEED